MNELVKNSPNLLKLNPKQLRFAQEYVIDLNGKRATIEAGYSPKTAYSKSSQLLKIVKIKEYIASLEKETAKRNEIKLDEIVLGIREVISKCKASKPYQSAQLLKAYELLAKMGGYLREQGIDQDQRPAFVGISINMGNGTVKMVSVKDNLKEQPKDSPKEQKVIDV